MKDDSNKDLAKGLARREFIVKAGAGTLLLALGGGLYRIAADDLTRSAQAQTRKDGRKRLPPGQKVIEELRAMGGQEGSGKSRDFKLKIHGEVERPFELSWDELMVEKQVDIKADVHCVTGWSMLGGTWSGVLVKTLADRAGLKRGARHVIFEAAHGYTANVPIDEALKPNVMVTHQLNNRAFRRKHGAPVRALVPDLYFWKSSKWLTGIRFVRRDEPGFWETRGYHNHGDPWREERYG